MFQQRGERQRRTKLDVRSKNGPRLVSLLCTLSLLGALSDPGAALPGETVISRMVSLGHHNEGRPEASTEGTTQATGLAHDMLKRTRQPAVVLQSPVPFLHSGSHRGFLP